MTPVRPPKFSPPSAGSNVDKSFVVALDPKPSDECLSIIQGQATILISRGLLEELSAATPERWETEEERLAVIHGNRAKRLLQDLKASAETGGKAGQTALGNESRFLVAELLESGQAAVVDNETGQPVSQLVVSFHGVRAGPLSGMGFISFSFKGQLPPFFETGWWVS
jgi:hypothetical protein